MFFSKEFKVKEYGLYTNGLSKLSNDNDDNTSNVFDVIVAGAGPCGSTCAYYLKKYAPHLKVGLCDKAKFPRDKYCGDAVMSKAVDILEEVGILQELTRENK